MAKRQSGTGSEIVESAHRVWLAGLGALAAAEEEGGKLFKNLVTKGERYERRFVAPVGDARRRVAGTVRRVTDRAGQTLSGIERAIDEQVTAALHRLGVPTRAEVERLDKRVAALTRALERRTDGSGKTTRARRATPARKKAPARGSATRARKPAAKKKPARRRAG